MESQKGKMQGREAKEKVGRREERKEEGEEGRKRDHCVNAIFLLYGNKVYTYVLYFIYTLTY